MIEVRNLSKRFGHLQAVDHLSFRAEDGTVTALLGPNGAGKTTTMRAICGMIKPDNGKIFIDGVDVGSDPLAAKARLGVLSEVRGLYPRLSAREHLRYFARLQGLEEPDVRKRCSELIDSLDMNGIADRRSEGFSHGERTKVVLASALMHSPQNVILDEPTDGLDVMSTRAVRDLIRSLRDEGRCVLFSSHVMQEVSAVCDLIVIVAAGRIVASGSPDTLRAATGLESLEDAFVALTQAQGKGA